MSGILVSEVGSELGLFRLRAVAGRHARPEQQQARGARKAGGRQNLQRGAALAGEFGVSRRPRDLVGGARQQRLGRRAKGQLGAGEDDQRARTSLVLRAGEAVFDVLEGQRLEFNFSGHCDLVGGAAGDRKGARRAKTRRAISSSGGAGSIQWRALFRVARDSPSKSRDGRVKVLGFDGGRRTRRKRRSQGFTREIKIEWTSAAFSRKRARYKVAAIAPRLSVDNPGPMTKHGIFSRLSRRALEQAPKKLMDFFEKSSLQRFDFERFPFEREALGARR